MMKCIGCTKILSYSCVVYSFKTAVQCTNAKRLSSIDIPAQIGEEDREADDPLFKIKPSLYVCNVIENIW